MTHIGRNGPRLRGFTLLEVVLALAIAVLLAVLGQAGYRQIIDRLRVKQAIVDISEIGVLIERYHTDKFVLPESLDQLPRAVPLDPWGRAYTYLNITTVKNPDKGKVRKDHKLVPLNTDYDLYSLGQDGKSESPLTAKASRDDIVRANNGGFIGLATDY